MTLIADYRLSQLSPLYKVPIRLFFKSGERLGGLLPGLDAASAMVISQCEDGSDKQLLIPLQIRLDTLKTVDRLSQWELIGIRSSGDVWVYFLEFPSDFLQHSDTQPALQSISIQIVGHSALRTYSSFAGHVTVGPGVETDALLLARFHSFVDSWFPTLLPSRHVKSMILNVLENIGEFQVSLLTLARVETFESVPSLKPDWDSNGWNDAVLEVGGEDVREHYLIRGGCFISPEGRVSHWFGGGIGLNRPEFRLKTSRKILSVAPKGEASWCFWLTPVVEKTIFEILPTQESVCIRHPVLGLAWVGPSAASAVARIEYRQAMDFLRQAAGLITKSLNSQQVRQFFSQHEKLLRRLAKYQIKYPEKLSNPMAAISEFAAEEYRVQEAS